MEEPQSSSSAAPRAGGRRARSAGRARARLTRPTPRVPSMPDDRSLAEEPQDASVLTDADLIRAAQTGAEWGFRILVERHQARAFRVARQMVPDSGDALDISQEAFLRVFRNLERFDPKHEFSTWLYRIVSNLCIDHLRKRRPTATGGGEDGDDGHPETIDTSVPDPSAGLEREELVARVRACIEALPPHFRSVLALRELEGLPCTEIARIVDATHVTVRWRLHRARKLFQEEWERRERIGAALSSSTPDTGDPVADGT